MASTTTISGGADGKINVWEDDGVETPTTASPPSKSFNKSFVDYIPPPTTPPPPPAKYKLNIIILPIIYVVAFLAKEAGMEEKFAESGYLHPAAARFARGAIEILVMVFFAMDPVIHLCNVKVCGTWYGIEPWLKQPRHEWVHKYDNYLFQFLAVVMRMLEEGLEIFNPPAVVAKPTVAKEYVASDRDVEVVLKIEHHVDPDKMKEYEAWKETMQAFMKTQPGLVGYEEVDPVDDLHVFQLTFTSIDELNLYMSNPVRGSIIEKLGPCLVAPTAMQVRNDRDIPDAFTDLLSRQGEGTPALPPKKWKVWWLSSVGLYFTLLLLDTFLPYYLDQWGLADSSKWIVLLISLVFIVPLMSYIIDPLLIMFFSEWVRRKEGEDDKEWLWKALNDGLSIPLQVVGCLLYIGGCVAGWATKSADFESSH